MMIRPHPTALLFLAAVVSIATVSAGQRTGFKKFVAKYDGGYNVNGPEIQNGGASKIVIRSSRSGDTSKVVWRNTFFSNEGVESKIRTVFRFAADGTFSANTIDPTRPGLAATGTYELKNRRITIAATSGETRTIGAIRLVGGGAMEIVLDVNGTAVEFHGGRK